MQESKQVGKFLCIQALAESLNLPAVATVNDLGIDKAFEAGEKFGLNMEKRSTVFLVSPWGAVLKPTLFKWLKHMLLCK